jgi:hypothetical protein
MAFAKWLSVKQKLQKSSLAPNCDPRNKYFPSSKFYVDLRTCIKCHQEQFLIWECGLILLQLILKNQ